MSHSVRVKICGLKTPADVDAAARAGAAYGGFVFFPKSPRHLDLETARSLTMDAPPGLAKVALTVNMADDALNALLDHVPIDMLQLHGSESPERVAEVKSRTGLPVMKAIGVGSVEDVTKIAPYARVADQLLLDAKPPKGADLPGGNGVSFDWSLVTGLRLPVPWMLAGGLTPETVAEAVAQTGAVQVDVSSGVDHAPGQKDLAKIAQFVVAAQRPAAA